MTNEIAVQAATELSIESEQAAFTDPQRAAILRMAGVEEAPDEELQVFFHQAKRTGLDPFSKQIYLIARAKRKKIKVNGKDEWVDDGHSYTIQTGIDGYRVLGHRVARARGDELAIPSIEWRSKTVGWTDAWLEGGPPAAARATILVNGKVYTATAMYAEYVQLVGSGDYAKPNSMWSKMPANQLAKCAEAAVWRLAYPNDFAGLVLEDAVQVIDESGAHVRQDNGSGRQVRNGGRGVAGIRARIAGKAEPVTDQQPVGDAPIASRFDALADKLTAAGIVDDAARGQYLSEQVGRPLSSWEDLTAEDIATVVARLDETATAGTKAKA